MRMARSSAEPGRCRRTGSSEATSTVERVASSQNGTATVARWNQKSRMWARYRRNRTAVGLLLAEGVGHPSCLPGQPREVRLAARSRLQRGPAVVAVGRASGRPWSARARSACGGGPRWARRRGTPAGGAATGGRRRCGLGVGSGRHDGARARGRLGSTSGSGSIGRLGLDLGGADGAVLGQGLVHRSARGALVHDVGPGQEVTRRAGGGGSGGPSRRPPGAGRGGCRSPRRRCGPAPGRCPARDPSRRTMRRSAAR